jgi:hypothetical protein
MLLRCALAVHSFALMLTAAMWWRVWRCLCNQSIEWAAFWTALAIAQSVIVLGIYVLRFK